VQGGGGGGGGGMGKASPALKVGEGQRGEREKGEGLSCKKIFKMLRQRRASLSAIRPSQRGAPTQLVGHSCCPF